jgi:hypothetical protein
MDLIKMIGYTSRSIARTGGQLAQFKAKSLLDSYSTCVFTPSIHVKEKYDSYMKTLAGKSGGKFVPSEIKQLYRSVHQYSLNFTYVWNLKYHH